MSTTKRHSDRPDASKQIDVVAALDFEAFGRAMNKALDRMTPRHLQACSVDGCVGTVVGVLDFVTEPSSLRVPDEYVRLCEAHLQPVLSMIDRWRRERELARSFNALSPIEQYQQESR